MAGKCEHGLTTAECFVCASAKYGPPKTTSERVQAMRAARDALGLKRLELYAHPEDWPAIKALAEKLQRKRAKLAAPRAG